MSSRKKWRRWCQSIDRDILEPYKCDKLIYEGYLKIIESNESIQNPANFHNWCCQNYGKSLLLYVRMLSDKNTQSYSVRKLVGQICQNNQKITRYALLRCYPKEHSRIYLEFWNKYIGKKNIFLPKTIPLAHIEEIKVLTKRAVNLTNKNIAHLDRKKRKRTFEFSEADKIIFRLVEILHFYSVLVGSQIACDINNYVIDYDWGKIFEEPWKMN